MNRFLITLATSLLLCACTSSHSFRLRTKQHLLHESVNEAGEAVTYTLIAGADGMPSVRRTTEEKYDVATLGLRVRSINQELSESSSLVPWRGVIVDRVDGASSGARAGILVGDVLLAIHGTSLSTAEQLKEQLRSYISPGATVQLSVLQIGTDKRYPAEPTEIQVALGSKEVTVTRSDTIALESDIGVFRLTGLQVGSLDSELANEIYGSPDTVTLVAGAMVGSPAYLAGLRSGDRVLSCDGQVLTSHRDVSRAVLARSRADKVPADWFAQETRHETSEAKGEIPLEVSGPLGPHSTTLKVVEGLDSRSNVHIPILYDCNSNVASTSWSVLDFIFQFGANYESRYRSSATRTAQNDSLLSIFPFGMFEFEHKQDYDRYCFFWWIQFKDHH